MQDTVKISIENLGKQLNRNSDREQTAETKTESIFLKSNSHDVNLTSGPHNEMNSGDSITPTKMQAYGTPGDQTQQRVARYLHPDDQVLTSADMTIISARGLNVTAKLTQGKGQHGHGGGNGLNS